MAVTQATLTQIFKVTRSQWATLVGGGSIGGYSLSANPNAIWLIEDSNAPITYEVIG